MFVLDTNTLIYFFKGKGRVAERMLLEKPGNKFRSKAQKTSKRGLDGTMR